MVCVVSAACVFVCKVCLCGVFVFVCVERMYGLGVVVCLCYVCCECRVCVCGVC